MAAGNNGFDAASKTYAHLVEAGIIDPTKVVRIALENAVSVASTLLPIEALMTDVPEPETELALLLTLAEPENDLRPARTLGPGIRQGKL